ncbi:hypothetical protein GGI19_003587 [Coemansia pectinata]|uniref:Uncharacterized protein n=1 Tax=Coemansia pectinata TaxID=1052879 RepID=A0A9W8GXF7_9FUNG|nr:hypothetical protein GGI19_003587 [Coemansia pectinata]
MLVCTLELGFSSGRYSKENAAMLPDIDANIGAFVRRIGQMVPKLNLVRLSGGFDPSNHADTTYRLIDSLTTQLLQLVDRVELTGNAATLELLKLTLTRELALALLRHNVFTPISHPKLQCVMLKTPQGPIPVSNADNPETMQLMCDIAPGVVVKKISQWFIDQAPPPVFSPFGKHDNLQVLALPDMRLST